MKKIIIAGVIFALMAAVGGYVFAGRTQQTGEITGNVMEVGERSITVETSDGQTTQLVNEATNVDAHHLKEHLEQKLPVTVFWQADGSQKVATRIEDAR